MQSLVEGICHLLPNSDPIQVVCSYLAAAFHSSIKINAKNQFTAAYHYQMYISTRNTLWNLRQEVWLPKVLEALRQLAHESEVIFPSPPILELIVNDTLSENQIQVSPFENNILNEITQPLPESSDTKDEFQNDSFFICPDSSLFFLNKNIVNIGRSKDNHLVIIDHRVSKKHAQIRASRQHFILFDLNSSLGTFVNGKRISQEILHPGDVVSLGGYSLIYGEDENGSCKSELPPTKKEIR